MSETWIDRYSESYLGIFGQPLLSLVRGEGSYVWDDTDTRYLDLVGGIAVNVLGHAHPGVARTIAEQSATLMHVSNFFTTPQQIAAAEAVQRIAGAPDDSRVMFVNSGAEANEAAMKIALRHRPGGRFVALEHSFHGRTLGSLGITWKPAYREPFAPITSGTTFVPPGDVEALAAELAAGDVAALFIEIIQGEAGVRPLDTDYVRACRELTRRHGALLIIDEVQTGIGRTGEWCAHTRHGVQPDVMTFAKGLGAGFPIGAVVAFGSAISALGPGQHGTTFGGNPLASSVALTVLGEVEQLLPRVKKLGEQWRAELAQVPGVVEVRGEGLLIGIEIERNTAEVASALRERGVLVNCPTPTALRIAPAFTISDDEAREFTGLLSEVLAD